MAWKLCFISILLLISRCVDKEIVLAHEIILKQCSSFFDKVLVQNLAEQADPYGKIVIILPGVRGKPLKQALNIIYTGKSKAVRSYYEVTDTDRVLRTIFGIRFALMTILNLTSSYFHVTSL